MYIFQVKLHFSEKALRLVAKRAMAKNTGARGLRAILESLLTDAMYEVNNLAAACSRHHDYLINVYWLP